MSLGSEFKNFCKRIELDNYEQMKVTVGEIAKKLNKSFYNLSDDAFSHMYIVGSVGRLTAIKKTSDLDILFDLPEEVYKQYDSYSDNGQSQLLQKVKKVLQEKYPKTDICGDGQVVVISFSKYTVELVPGFKQENDAFIYPDTHDGGSWKVTDPIPEQNEVEFAETESNHNYRNFCRIIRKWKNTVGASIGGLLIDTLVYEQFKDNKYYSDSEFKDYYSVLQDILEYLKDQDSEKEYWTALGSGQHIKNTDKIKFNKKAKSGYKKLNDAETEEDQITALQELLGSDFAPNNKTALSSFDNEEFIENLVEVDIRNNLKIDCKVSQDGFRTFFLSDLLKSKGHYLQLEKNLEFLIKYHNVQAPYEIWWKVRNVGDVAEKNHKVRGEILKTNSYIQQEHSNFRGPHFVECYLIKNGVCVARDRISVPIEE